MHARPHRRQNKAKNSAMLLFIKCFSPLRLQGFEHDFKTFYLRYRNIERQFYGRFSVLIAAARSLSGAAVGVFGCHIKAV